MQQPTTVALWSRSRGGDALSVRLDAKVDDPNDDEGTGRNGLSEDEEEESIVDGRRSRSEVGHKTYCKKKQQSTAVPKHSRAGESAPSCIDPSRRRQRDNGDKVQGVKGGSERPFLWQPRTKDQELGHKIRE